ncbi:hypothetical protein K1719_030220 [Acacia pycnantha]|nr:hypothetical protein K1719_030220 [Acacia pycnantha]
MKTNALLEFFFFFSAALFAITTAEIVLDSEGHPLKNGGNYSLSTTDPTGEIAYAYINGEGGLSLAVVVNSSEAGWTTNIISPCATQNITTYSPLWISFLNLPPPWNENPLWVVTHEPEFGEAVMVMIEEPLSGCFFIKPFNSTYSQYKLVFFYEHGKCGHVGVKNDSHGNHRLVVTEDEVQPLVVVFHNETRDEVVASDISMVV